MVGKITICLGFKGRISQGNPIKNSLYQDKKTHHREKDSNWLIFHCKIEKAIEKAATKVGRANDERYYIQKTYTYILIEIMRHSLRVQFGKWVRLFEPL